MIVLPDKKSEIDTRFQSQSLGVIGAPGVGKSSFFSEDNLLYIQTENGLNALSVFKVPCHSWNDYREICSSLMKQKTEGKLNWDGVVIDTIDELVKLADQEVVSIIKNKFKSKADDVNSIFDYPAASDKGNPAWGWRRDIVMNSLKALQSLGIAVIYIGHMDFRDIKTPTAVYHKKTISIGGQLGTDLVSWCDHFLTMESTRVNSETKRVIRTISDSTLDAKSRGNLVPDMFPLSADIKDNWKRFRQLFK